MFPDFTELWLVAFQLASNAGELPRPICMVAKELRTAREIRLGPGELLRTSKPPYPAGDSYLMVSYAATADLACHIALGWPLPTHVLDLYAEFRVITNGPSLPDGSSLAHACDYFGARTTLLPEHKEVLQDLAVKRDHTAEELRLLVDCCAEHVRALEALLTQMHDRIDLPRALLRGRYVTALTQVEVRGIPIDTEGLQRFRGAWAGLRSQLITGVDGATGVYEGASFRIERFGAWLEGQGISWPRTVEGRLQLDDETFREMAERYHTIRDLRELRKTLASMRGFNLQAGVNGRSRPALKPWQSRTGRNQPSTSSFAFGLPAWMRSFILPASGRALSYVDWSQQEFGIAAALSGDQKMIEAYSTGDPYLAFAMQAGAVPAGATKLSHAGEREQFKACTLAVQYGMGERSLARRIGQTRAHATALLQRHRHTYPQFWRWSDRVVDRAIEDRELVATFGWRIGVGSQINERSIRNFPMQANGAEMMRLACILAVEAGIEVCAPVHDAFLIEASADQIADAETRMQACMAEASRIVLGGGLELRSEFYRITHPDRYRDPRGTAMWELVQALLTDFECGMTRTCCISARYL